MQLLNIANQFKVNSANSFGYPLSSEFARHRGYTVKMIDMAFVLAEAEIM